MHRVRRSTCRQTSRILYAWATVFTLVGTLIAPTRGESPYLVKDIDPGFDYTGSSSANYYVTIDGTTFFLADDGVHGMEELFKTDGTPEGTVLVKDIAYGPDRSYARNLINVDGTLFFFTGSHLWKSDGTTVGTVPVKAIQFEAWNLAFYASGGKLYFDGSDGVHGRELWVSDGTESGTYMVMDINTNVSSGYNAGSTPYDFCEFNGRVLFSASDGTHNREPWITDGTAAGTMMLKDTYPGNVNGFYSGYTVVGSAAYFLAYPSTSSSYTLFKTDGTIGGTVAVKDHIGSVWQSVSFQNKLFFVCQADGDQELWTSDGTVDGTVLFKDLEPGVSNKSRPTAMIVIGSMLYFVTCNETSGVRLWKSDGTPAGTTVLAQLYPSYSSSSNLLLLARNVGGKLVLIARLDYKESHLWASDSTPEGTVDMTTFTLSTSFDMKSLINMQAANGDLFFTRYDTTHGSEPWVTDGTPAGTHRFTDVNKTPNGVNIAPIVCRGQVFFTFSDSSHGTELWRSDGTEAGTCMVKDICPGATGSSPMVLTAFNNKVYFTANDGIHGKELWCSDGTAGGTSMVLDLEPGASGSAIDWTYLSGANLYFQATTAAQGLGVWSTSGIPGHATFLASIRLYAPNPLQLLPDCVCDWNGRFCLAGVDANNQTKLWISDGTPAGTMKLEDFVQYPMSWSPRYLTPVGNYLFTVYPWDGESYATDGTPAGTCMYHQFSWGHDNRVTVERTALNGNLIVLLDKEIPELWRSGGTAAGTQLISNAFTWPQGGATPRILGILGGILYFSINDGVHGHELWRTDGTSAGTAFFKEINPSGDSAAADGIVFGDRLYFRAGEPDHGNELWSTDGTAAGTIINNVNPGLYSSTPSNFTVAGNTLFFTADDGVHGRELWALPLDDRAAETIDVAAGDTAPALSGTASMAVDFSSNSAPGRLTMARYNAMPPGRTNDLSGYWIVSGLHDSTFGVALTFNYDPSAVSAAGLSESDLRLIRSMDGGRTWTEVASVVDADLNTIRTASAQATLGMWAISAADRVPSMEIWVNFHWGYYEAGTAADPFNTMLEAIGAVGNGGKIKVNSGTTIENPRIIKPMRIEPVGGTVRIGAN